MFSLPKHSDEGLNNWTNSPHITSPGSNVCIPSQPSSLSPVLSHSTPRGYPTPNCFFSNTQGNQKVSLQQQMAKTTLPPQCCPNTNPTKKMKLEHPSNQLPEILSPVPEEISQPNDSNVPLFNFKELEGKFEIQDRLGSGTFSNVFKAFPLFNKKKLPSVVALKRIHPTCAPSRILSEMNFLKVLGGTAHVPALLGGVRFEDQITLVLPYFEHDRFKELLMNISIDQIRIYMKALFESLEHLHKHGVIHRDIKPGNFLFNSQTNQAMLVDFGLSEWQETPPRNQRKPVKAQRAGTRGFRAPEVLLKYPYQTGAIDVWSAGIILLSFLTKRYPFFGSPDDLTSLCEIGALCGTRQLSAFAEKLNRKLTFPKECPKQNIHLLSNTLAPRNIPFPPSIFKLFDQLMELDPTNRISPTEALQSDFIQNK